MVLIYADSLVKCFLAEEHKVESMPGNPSDSHNNITDLLQERKIDSHWMGVALKDDGLWREHSWGLKGTTIVESTVSFLVYIGFDLDQFKSWAEGLVNKKREGDEPVESTHDKSGAVHIKGKTSKDYSSDEIKPKRGRPKKTKK